ncbi:MAG TPA: carboxypeptidase regulatory-like domain-containing protein, partial [Gemmatimonadales bacterium]|nr:carboxypeptidase regulatory-like domain-containing protein [Gemmatimonadales bacterium]
MLRQIIPVTLLLLAACGDSTGPGTGGGGGGGGATLAGTVRVAGQSATLAGATVSAGTLKATSDENGHFELTSVPVGTATVRAERPGYQPAEATITLAAGANSHDFGLTAQEIYQFGAIAALVPAGTEPMRG